MTVKADGFTEEAGHFLGGYGSLRHSRRFQYRRGIRSCGAFMDGIALGLIQTDLPDRLDPSSGHRQHLQCR
jgi:hypothetical protein